MVASIIVFLVTLSVLAAYHTYIREKTLKNEYRKGFTWDDIHSPTYTYYSITKMEDKPRTQRIIKPGMKYSIRWIMYPIYARFGGVIEIYFKNSGDNTIFVYGCGIDAEWSKFTKEVGIYVEKKSEVCLGLLSFDGPNKSGNYSYTVKVWLMAKGPGGVWYDYGECGNRSNIMEVLPLSNTYEVEEKRNLAYYYDKVNNVVNPSDKEVMNVVEKIKEKFGSNYTSYHILASFDYVRKNINYVDDPKGRDYWSPSGETIKKGGGDCEDQSILFCSLIKSMNGTVRFIVIEKHAFSAVYVGKDIKSFKKSCEIYYDTPVKITYFTDEYGYWVIADTTSSLYLGGLPLEGAPTETSWTFTNTTFVCFVDVV